MNLSTQRTTTELASAVFEGTVRHRRFAPHPHAFTYRVAQLYLDLDEVESIFAERWFWSVDRRNLAEFRRTDYLAPHGHSLADAVRERVQQVAGYRPAGPIRLLTHLRYFGYSFNPVSFYYCFKPDGSTLDCVVAEITNMPWRERHVYVLPVTNAQARGRTWHWSFTKAFHVSPFMPMAREYGWRFTTPDRNLFVHMDVWHEERRNFDATLNLQRLPLNGKSLARVLWRYPLMTTRIVAAIHWQALRLWMKRNPVYDHPVLSKSALRRGST